MRRKLAVFAVIGLLLLLPVQSAMASTASNVATVALSLTISNSVTISASPASITFDPITGAASAPIQITSSWNLQTPSSNFQIAAWFASPSSALSNGVINIPSSQITGSNGGGPLPFTGTDTSVSAAVAGATVAVLPSTSIPASGNRTDTLTLAITGLSTQAPGSYTGTVNIAAQAN